MLLIFGIVDVNKVHQAMAAENSAKSQSDKFKEAARDLDCDEDEARWNERLKKAVKPSRDTPPKG